MKKWQDDYFEGNRLDTEKKTGVGTMNFKKIAEAFDLRYLKIKSVIKCSQLDEQCYEYYFDLI